MSSVFQNYQCTGNINCVLLVSLRMNKAATIFEANVKQAFLNTNQDHKYWACPYPDYISPGPRGKTPMAR